MSLQHFIQEYGYWALFLGTILEGETIMLLAGFAASQGHLSLPWVCLVGFLGAVTGDQFFFYLGRWKGKEYLANHPAWAPYVCRVRHLMDRYDMWILIGFRFLYGLRTSAPAVFGALGVRASRFSIGNTIGGVAWAAVMGAIGFLFGKALIVLMEDVRSYEHLVIGGIALIGLLAGLLRSKRGIRVDCGGSA